MRQNLAITIIVAIFRVNAVIVREDDIRSSTIQTKDNYRLEGCTFDKHKSTTIVDCAQSCLIDTRCLSFNFGNMDVCFLNNKRAPETPLVFSEGFTYGEMLNITVPDLVFRGTPKPVEEYTFTCLGATGHNGPTTTIQYKGTNLQDSVQLDGGKQKWTVPKTAFYTIVAYGASGANSSCRNDGLSSCQKGGLGAKITGKFYLNQGTVLEIIVGQVGLFNSILGTAGGGGGGTFVIKKNENKILVAAGGGGGSGKNNSDPGQADNNGTRCGGFNGSGGRLCDPIGTPYCSSGAGYYKNGSVGPKADANLFIPPLSYFNGGTGGKANMADDVAGGYGGGGFGLSCGGGGGGYSGGGYIANSTTGISGGGGSYNSGSSQENLSGVNREDGRVVIKLL